MRSSPPPPHLALLAPLAAAVLLLLPSAPRTYAAAAAREYDRSAAVDGGGGGVVGVVVGTTAAPRSDEPPDPSRLETDTTDEYDRTASPPPSSSAPLPLDLPVSSWSGRLLFSRDRRLPGGSVLMDVHNAPPPHERLIGTIVELRWDPEDAEAASFSESVTTDVNFTEDARASVEGGNVHPERLDGLVRVGPLESLAGSRPEDDVEVSLPGRVEVVGYVEEEGEGGGGGGGGDDGGGGGVALLIRRSPVQVSGRSECLVRFLGPANDDGDGDDDDEDGSGAGADDRGPPERLRVAHYNPAAGAFEGGAEEVMTFPDYGAVHSRLRRFTSDGIELSPANVDGWYVYGERGGDGIFTISAIEPRRCLRLIPDEVRLGLKAGRRYIKRDSWSDEPARKGTVRSVLLDPDSTADAEAAAAHWGVGDRAIVIHLFGGSVGADADGGAYTDLKPGGLVLGHLSYGDARVVRCPFTGEAKFDIVHRQVYAHNGPAILSGPQAWHCYMGDLRRGWLGQRPVSDVIVKFDPATRTYDAGKIKFDPMGEVQRELDEMCARYRVGDGTGGSSVGSERSCSQDSNQALFAAIWEAEREAAGAGGGGLRELLMESADGGGVGGGGPSAVDDLSRLERLGSDMERFLTPLGIRRDWRGTAGNLHFAQRPRGGKFWRAVRTVQTWRTVLPRRAHDSVASIFLRRGAKLWVIRTDQVGGHDPDLVPLAPTLPFGGGANRGYRDALKRTRDPKC